MINSEKNIFLFGGVKNLSTTDTNSVSLVYSFFIRL